MSETRRAFLGSAMLALPILAIGKIGGSSAQDADPVLDQIADEVGRIAGDIARGGALTADHARRLASTIRVMNAESEDKGLNAKADSLLDSDEFVAIDANAVADYWSRHGVILDAEGIRTTTRLADDRILMVKIRKAIKKDGGVGKLHIKMADTLDAWASQHDKTQPLRINLVVRNGHVVLPRAKARTIVTAAEDGAQFWKDWDCLCIAMVTEAAILFVASLLGCVPCAGMAGLLLLEEKLMELLNLCDPKECSPLQSPQEG